VWVLRRVVARGIQDQKKPVNVSLQGIKEFIRLTHGARGS
jgi:sulfur transfer complex TusBCD TusB component (DsrH family)